MAQGFTPVGMCSLSPLACSQDLAVKTKKIPNLSDIYKIQDLAHMYTREVRKSYYQHFVIVFVYSL